MAGVKGRSGGARPGAGRKPKQPEVIEIVMPIVVTDPVEFLERVMSDPMADAKLRVDAAKALLPYKHAKKGEVGKKEEAAERAKSAASKFKPATPPPPTRLQ